MRSHTDSLITTYNIVILVLHLNVTKLCIHWQVLTRLMEYSADSVFNFLDHLVHYRGMLLRPMVALMRASL